MDFSLLLAAHGHVDQAQFLAGLQGFLGGLYLSMALMNAVAALYLWHWQHLGRQAVAWLIVAAACTVLAALGGSGMPLQMPGVIRSAANAALSGSTGPVVYTLGTLALLVGAYALRRWWVRPPVAWAILNLSILFLGLSITNQDFATIVTKPDNVPIVGLIYLLGYFTWLATYKAVQNDDRIAQGLPPLEKEGDEKVLVWPDLVYIELICMVAISALLIVWAILLRAPLEEMSSSVKTPNPSKAPWYFLGLQEMLVYFDPWMAGVVMPSLIIFGLMAIPYLDYNKKGMGYYTISERKFSYAVFQLGFLELWVTLIILGTFLRGPNWGFFGPYEPWDAHKVESLNNVDLSQIFWIKMIGWDLPKAPTDAGKLTELGYIVLREAPGIFLTLTYLILLPPIMAVTVFRKMFVKMGFLRYMLMTNLLLFMVMLPIKMSLRWMFNLKYIIHIDEYFLNL